MISFPNIFTKGALTALNQAQLSAAVSGHSKMGTGNILMGLCQGADELTKCLMGDVPLSKVFQTVYAHYGHGETSFARVTDVTAHAQRVLIRAAAYADSEKNVLAGVAHLWQELLYEEGCTAQTVLIELGKTLEGIQSTLNDTVGVIERPEKAAAIPASDKPMPKIVVEVTSRQGTPTEEKPKENGKPALETYARCLTQEAKEGRLEPLIGRQDELRAMIRVLGKKMKNNPLLIGEPGVGKSALAEGLSQAVVRGDVPPQLKEAKIYALDLAQMVAGTKFRGEFEERMKAVINETAKQENVILFIDEVHSLVGAGDSHGAMDAANIIKPALARGNLRVIGATTYKEYQKYIEKDAALARRFQRIDVREPDKAQTLDILKGLRERYEKFHHVIITDEALAAAVELSMRYVTDRFLPDKAIDLIDEASSMARIEGWQERSLLEAQRVESEADEEIRELNEEAKALPEAVIDKGEIARVVSQWTGVPVERVGRSDQQDVMNLSEQLARRVVGQDEAIASVARAIRRSRAGLGDPTRPMGVFMLMGPSGVGKTELCKALSEAMFGSEDAMVRVDMSEYSEEASVARLVGSPPGYVGHEEGGQLTDAVIKRPYSVVLFDEIEKAHPKVFNLLLQLLDDGQLTDSVGRKVNFRNTIVMMTSNSGVSFDMDKRMGFSSASAPGMDRAKIIMEQAKRTFRPEFLGRIDEIIVMNSLTQENGKHIAEIMLQKVQENLLRQGVILRWEDDVPELLASEGMDAMSGARNLRRTVQRMVEDPLCDLLLMGQASETVVISARNGEIVFGKEEFEPAFAQ